MSERRKERSIIRFMPMRPLLAILVLGSFLPASASVAPSDYETCSLTLESIDGDGDDLLSRDREYVSLVNTLANLSFDAAQTFSDLPPSLQSLYEQFVPLRGSRISISKLNKKELCERLQVSITSLPKHAASPRLLHQSENHRILQAQNETESYDFCLDKMRISDSDRNSLFDKGEYNTFAVQLSNHQLSDPLSSNAENIFDTSFHSLAEGGEIDVYGAAPGQNVSLEQSEFLRHVCNTTLLAISNVTSPANSDQHLATPQESPNPTSQPSISSPSPTSAPSSVPSSEPQTTYPSLSPSSKPLTTYPSLFPSSRTETSSPSLFPSPSPSSKPSTTYPSLLPSSGPSSKPYTPNPSLFPTESPSIRRKEDLQIPTSEVTPTASQAAQSPGPTSVPSSSPTKSEPTITIHSSFIIAGTVSAIIDALSKEDDDRGLTYAYSELVSHVVWEQNTVRKFLRSRRRELATSIHSHSPKLYAFVESDCGETVSASLCQTVYASYELIVDDDVGLEEVYSIYVEATSNAIEEGRLQQIWENINTDSEVSVTGIGEQIVPPDVTENPADETITDEVTERQSSPTPSPTTSTSDAPFRGLWGLSDTTILVLCIVSIALVNWMTVHFVMSRFKNDSGSASVAPIVKTDESSAFEVFDDEDESPSLTKRHREEGRISKHSASSGSASRKSRGIVDSSHSSKQSKKRDSSNSRTKKGRIEEESEESEDSDDASEESEESEESEDSEETEESEEEDSSEDEQEIFDDEDVAYVSKTAPRTAARNVSSSSRSQGVRLVASDRTQKRASMGKQEARLSKSEHTSNRKDTARSHATRKAQSRDEFSTSRPSSRLSSSEHVSKRQYTSAKKEERLQKSEHSRVRFKEEPKQRAPLNLESNKDGSNEWVELNDHSEVGSAISGLSDGTRRGMSASVAPEFREKIEDLVRTIDPSQLQFVDKMLADYRGRERDLLIMLEKRIEASEKAQKRKKIESLLKQVEPEKLDQIDEMIAEYNGDESALIESLKLKRSMLRKVYELRDSQRGKLPPDSISSDVSTDMTSSSVRSSNAKRLASSAMTEPPSQQDGKSMDGSGSSNGSAGRAEIPPKPVEEQMGRSSLSGRLAGLSRLSAQGNPRGSADMSSSRKSWDNTTKTSRMSASSSGRRSSMDNSTKSVKDTFRETVVQMVEMVDPQMLSSVDSMIEEYKGREKALIVVLQMQAKMKSQRDFRLKVQSLLEEIAPDQVKNLDDMLKQYKGREKELLVTLKFRQKAIARMKRRLSQEGSQRDNA